MKNTNNKILWKIAKILWIIVIALFALLIFGICCDPKEKKLQVTSEFENITENQKKEEPEQKQANAEIKKENLSLRIFGKKIFVQDRLIKNGKIGYISANKGTITEPDLIQFYNDSSNFEYKWLVIHFAEDETALHIIPRIGTVTYGTYDKENFCLKTELGWMSIIGNSATKEKWSNGILK